MSVSRKVVLLLMLPTITILLLVSIYPTIYAFYVSLFKWEMTRPGPKVFVGIDNFLATFLDRDFVNALKVTFIFTSVAVSSEFFLGLGIALLLNREFMFKRIVTGFILMPMMLTPVVVGLVWRMFYSGDYGLINYFLGLINIECYRPWLGEISTALPSIILVDIWEWTPFIALLLLAGLQSVPQEPLEAAELDGATKLQSLKYITIPLLKSTILVALIIRTMDAIRVFDTVFILTRGGPGRSTETISLYIYEIAFKTFNIGYAMSMSIILLFIIIFLCLLFIKCMKEARK